MLLSCLAASKAAHLVLGGAPVASQQEQEAALLPLQLFLKIECSTVKQHLVQSALHAALHVKLLCSFAKRQPKAEALAGEVAQVKKAIAEQLQQLAAKMGS